MKTYKGSFFQVHKGFPILFGGLGLGLGILFPKMLYLLRKMNVIGWEVNVLCVLLLLGILTITFYLMVKIAVSPALFTLEEDFLQVDFTRSLWFLPASFRLPINQMQNFSTNLPSGNWYDIILHNSVWYLTISTRIQPRTFSIMATNSSTAEGKNTFQQFCDALKAKVIASNIKGTNITFKNFFVRMLAKTLFAAILILGLLIFASKVGWIK